MSKWLFTRLPGISRNVIYTAAVCPHKIFIYTAAVKVPNRLYTRLPYMFSKMVICTAAIQEQFRQYTKDIYTAAGRECLCRNGYLHGRRESAENVIYTAAVCPHKIFIYTAAVKVPNWLYTRLPYMFSKMVICTASIQEQFRQYTCLRGFILRIGSTYVKMVIYTAAIKESNWLFSRLPGVSKNRYLHGSRVSTLIIYLKGSHSSAKSAAYTAVVYVFKKRLS